jgi:hypothetical protein
LLRDASENGTFDGLVVPQIALTACRRDCDREMPCSSAAIVERFNELREKHAGGRLFHPAC